jgi:hypothetical protein
MIFQAKKDTLLLHLFKAATILRALCLIANLTIHPYIANDNIINNIIHYSLLISVISISVIVSIKTVQFFTQHHQYLMLHYKTTGLIIESCIAGIVTMLLFFNQSITGKFVVFIADLSKQVHSNQLTTLIILLLLIFCVQLYQAYRLNKRSINDPATTKMDAHIQTIKFHVITLILKLCIITGTAIGFIDPFVIFLQPTQLKKFDSLIFHFTTTEIFLYIHTIIMILLSLWITIGIYYVYKFYKKRR